MDKFKRMQTFVRIVEGGSLTAAANALEVSQPSVVRLLAALEADLGVRLINRTTRRMALTDEGREYYERCRAILGAVDEAEAQLKSRRAEPRGRLRLTAPVLFGRLFIAPVVNEFLARHAAVQVELLLLDRVVDLLEEGIDAAVRLARLADSSLVAVPLGAVRRVTVGSPALIRRRGRPARAEDLAGAPVVSFTGPGPADEWSFERAGRALRVKVAPVFVSNQIDAALAAGEAGLGWGRFLSYQVAAALRDGRLKRVLDDEDATPLPVQIVYPHARLLSANLRALVDFAVPRLRKQLAALD
ncbi:MAG: LysR family transcriptional regulator [Burkholderiales bacterium]|jgi:DNA-binding transcriptional LysR family regulator|nr:LysR family transcriptional regulator [Burkholderiales bacterium]